MNENSLYRIVINDLLHFAPIFFWVPSIDITASEFTTISINRMY